MARKKKQTSTTRRSTTVSPANQDAAGQSETAAGIWPETFAPPRRALILGCLLAMWGCLMFLCGFYNLLLPIKHLLGAMVGLDHPAQLGTSGISMDLAWLLFAAGTILVGTLIHPLLGIGGILLFRPWLDGYTFPTDNVYFLWAAMGILIYWGMKSLMGGLRLRGGIATALLAAFLLFLLATMVRTINYEESYRALLLWSTYGAVFLVTLNGAANRGVIRALTLVMVFVMVAQAVFAILQFEFLLPYMRKLLTSNSALREQFFGVAEWTPELARRFNVNRAFGTVLFPNALAALIILMLPAAFSLAVTAWRGLEEARNYSATGVPGTDDQRRYRSFVGGCVVWLAATVAIFIVLQFPILYDTGGSAWYKNTMVTLALALAGGLVPAGLFFVQGVRHGAAYAVRHLVAILLVASVPTLFWSLWITYSRGAMLALFLACALAAVLYMRPGRLRDLLRARPAVNAAIASILAGSIIAGGIMSGSTAQAQDPAPASPTAPEVREEGIDVGVGDLADTATLSLRFTYWKVGMRMFADNWLTGVGIGNFKWAYPRYQYPGAGDVREAHNSYLQAYNETGILGGTVLLLFWAWIACYGAWRILMEEDRRERLMLLGLYTGVIAFCLHSFIDINFAHASLMTFAMALAALFLARAQVSTAKAPAVTWHGMVIMVALVLAAVVAGLSTRLYSRDLALSRVQMINVNGEKPLQDRYTVAHHLLQAVPDAVTADRNPAPIALSAMKLIIDDIDAVNDYGVFYTPVPGDPRKVQKVEAGAPVPDNALFFVKRWARMLRPTLEASLEWVQQLKRMDARFPHSPELALEISYWYKLFTEPRFTFWMSEEPERFLKPLIEWSEEAVHRNPYSPDLRLNLARAHLAASRHTQNEDQREHLAQALENFREAHLFAPAKAPYLDALVHYSEVVADAYQEAGLPELAERYRKQAVAAKSDRDALVETLRAHARGEL